MLSPLILWGVGFPTRPSVTSPWWCWGDSRQLIKDGSLGSLLVLCFVNRGGSGAQCFWWCLAKVEVLSESFLLCLDTPGSLAGESKLLLSASIGGSKLLGSSLCHCHVVSCWSAFFFTYIRVFLYLFYIYCLGFLAIHRRSNRVHEFHLPRSRR